MIQIGLQDSTPSLDQTVAAQQKAMHFWIYMANLQAFVLSSDLKTFLGLDPNLPLIPLATIRRKLRPLNQRRVSRIFVGRYKKSYIIEDLEVLDGPHKGEMVLATAGVISRQENGSVLLISGVLTDDRGGNGRFFTHSISSDGTWDWDVTSGEIKFSESFKSMLGYEPAPDKSDTENYEDAYADAEAETEAKAEPESVDESEGESEAHHHHHHDHDNNLDHDHDHNVRCACGRVGKCNGKGNGKHKCKLKIKNVVDHECYSDQAELSERCDGGVIQRKEDYFPHTFKAWCDDLTHPDDITDIVNKINAIIQSPDNGDYYETCMRLRHADGHYIWSLERGVVISRNAKGIATRIVGYNSNVDLLAKALDGSTYDAYHDSLTGVYNREYLEQQRPYLESSDASPVSVIYIDITGLKAANDYLGHKYGDELIKHAATLLSTTINDSGVIVRLGGDEFVAIMPHCTSMRASMFADTYKTLCEQNNDWYDLESEHNIPLIPGFGVATMGENDINTLKDLVELADARCQALKQAHKEENYAIIREILKRKLGFVPSLVDARTAAPEDLNVDLTDSIPHKIGNSLIKD